jgi:hypothetical protein
MCLGLLLNFENFLTIITGERVLGGQGLLALLNGWLLFKKCCITNALDGTEGDYLMEQY